MYPKEMHTVNAALLRCLRECKTWAQVTEWADSALAVYRQAQQMRDEASKADEMRAEMQAGNSCGERLLDGAPHRENFTANRGLQSNPM